MLVMVRKNKKLVNLKVQQGVLEWKEMSSGLMWVKVNFAQEMWVFLSAHKLTVKGKRRKGKLSEKMLRMCVNFGGKY